MYRFVPCLDEGRPSGCTAFSVLVDVWPGGSSEYSATGNGCGVLNVLLQDLLLSMKKCCKEIILN